MIATQTNSKDTKTSNADLLARLQALEEENRKLKEARNSKLALKISTKGAVSLWPRTLADYALPNSVGACSGLR